MPMLPTVPLQDGVVRRDDTLADGRDLFYYDDPGSSLPAERAADARTLDPRPATATMRHDPLTGEWVSIASARQNRVFLPPADLDPLAPASATNPSEVPDRYDVAVFENRSPSFGPTTAADAAVDPDPSVDPDGGIGRSRPSVGRCEVVCFSPEHEGSLGSQRPERLRTVVEAWADRTAALSAVPGVEQVFPFENRGEAIGVTLRHPHGQIYAYPYVTPRTLRLAASVEAHGPSLFDDILAFELASERAVIRGERWSAYVPFAARWPLELHIMPHRHVADLSETDSDERAELAELLPRVLRGIDAIYGDPTPYIAAWHQAPVHHHRDIRLTLQITSPRRAPDRLKYLAGSESAMGAFIGDVLPETQAAAWKEAVR
jgi:UDPglucose--hexose-1-phosphate uridylyltransferase